MYITTYTLFPKARAFCWSDTDHRGPDSKFTIHCAGEAPPNLTVNPPSLKGSGCWLTRSCGGDVQEPSTFVPGPLQTLDVCTSEGQSCPRNKQCFLYGFFPWKPSLSDLALNESQGTDCKPSLKCQLFALSCSRTSRTYYRVFWLLIIISDKSVTNCGEDCWKSVKQNTTVLNTFKMCLHKSYVECQKISSLSWATDPIFPPGLEFQLGPPLHSGSETNEGKSDEARDASFSRLSQRKMCCVKWPAGMT